MSGTPPRRGRLGIYVDAVFRRSGARVSTDRAFLLFAAEVGSRFDGLVLFGRTLDNPDSADYDLPTVELVELPHYTSLLHLAEVAQALPATVRAMWRGLGKVDTVWVIGPNPFDLLLIGMALLRRRRVALGVRQDTVAYYRARAPAGAVWRLGVGVMRLIDGVYKLLARRIPTVVVGEEIARRYGADLPTVLPMTVSLVRTADVASHPPQKRWDGAIELVTVGRLEREKNPLLLVEALAELERATPGRYHLTWVGRGPLEDDVLRRADALGVRDRITLQGYVPFGPELFDLYQRAHLFVHVSLTEGVPQVIVEAVACGTPVVATDVGGVRAAFGDTGVALLVPPADRHALVRAIQDIILHSEPRDARVARGLELAKGLTLEVEAERVARFIAREAGA